MNNAEEMAKLNFDKFLEKYWFWEGKYRPRPKRDKKYIGGMAPKTYPIEGSPYGDLHYAGWEKFPPGGSYK
jgi:hypothetical protein